MTAPISEFAIHLPMSSVGAVGAAAPAMDVPVPTVDVTAAVELPSDIDGSKFDHITVYVDSSSLVDYDPKNPVVNVDLVLSVSVQNPQSLSCSTYKLVKRLAMDKVKLATQAETMTPVSVVEHVTPEQEAQKLAEAQHAASAYRARELAGLI